LNNQTSHIQRHRRDIFVALAPPKTKAPSERHLPPPISLRRSLIRFKFQFYKYAAPMALGSALRLAEKIKPAYGFPMSKARAYHSDPDILGGTLVFKGTRVPVQSLFDHLKAGDSTGDFLEGFPSVKRSQVLAVLKEMEAEVLTHA
jgi:uncharacterized protein (DUF433 family)